MSNSGKTRDELMLEWQAAQYAGTFLTDKHDPNFPVQGNSYQTKVTAAVSGSLTAFLDSGNFEVGEFFNSARNEYVYSLSPASGSLPGNLGTAFAGRSPISGSAVFDSLYAFGSGSANGWHCAVDNVQALKSGTKLSFIRIVK
ncbi:MAG: hypothetical protein Q8S73_08040 [Deltaproteobacteria bacterium]|nr:hypothetical protein [Myxococcales bacterium]MDP3214038.1 hypothetical protein [Deltaproteobacteria bacterium]